MTVNATVAPTVPASDTRRPRRRALLAAGLVGALALTACTSDPGPKRVARDIIEAEAERNPDLDEDCLLEALDEFSDDELRDIESDLSASNTDRNAEGEAALQEYQQRLERCG